MNQREEQRQRTLEAIRQSVDEIVTGEGPDRLTIRGVCQRAGIKHGTFYHYFSSKDDLIMDRQIRFDTYFDDLYNRRLRDMPVKDALKLYAAEYIRYIQTRLLPMLITFEKTLLSLCTKEKLPENNAQKILKRLIGERISKGEFKRDQSPESIYDFFQVFFLGIRILFCHTGGGSLPNPDLEGEIGIWIDGL